MEPRLSKRVHKAGRSGVLSLARWAQRPAVTADAATVEPARRIKAAVKGVKRLAGSGAKG